MALTDLLPHWPLLVTFLISSVVIAVTPGPGVLYIVTRSLVEGRRLGMASVAGVAVGNLGNAVAASAGLAALFAVSSLALSVVRYVGALYLVYLGIRMIRSASVEDSLPMPEPASVGRAFREGTVIALFNPKTTVFFAAFLPQFLNHDRAPLFQSLALGLIFVSIASVTDSAYALGAGAVALALRRRQARRVSRRLGGGMFIGLGIFTALAGSRGAR